MGTLRKQPKSRATAWVGMTCFLTAVSGCKGGDVVPPPSTASTTSTTTVVSSGGGAVTVQGSGTADAFKVTLDSVDAAHAITSYFFHSQASFSSACSIVPGSTAPSNNIYCYLDVNELDLYMNGISLRFNSPPTMCDYTSVKPYVYFGLAAGTVASGTTCSVLVNTSTGAITDGSGNPPKCSDSGGGNGNMAWNGAGFVCNYDHSANGDPNCCEGQYTLKSGTYDGTKTTWTFSTVSAGGKIASCFTGPGKDLPGFQTSGGVPTEMLIRTVGTGVNGKVDFPSPQTKQRPTNLYLGNFWDPRYFQRTATVEGGGFPLASPGDFPKAYANVTNPFTGAVYRANPYYEIGCLDKAEDYIARIRVLVRPWDQVSNFNNAANGIPSNPYTDPTTGEPGFNDYYNDRSGWTLFSSSPPAGVGVTSDTFPGMSL